MTAYRLLDLLYGLCVALLIAAYFVLRTALDVWAALAIVIGAAFVLACLLPSRRKLARKHLARGTCPKCGAPVRKYPHEECLYYCPACMIGFTEKGSAVERGQE